MARSSNQKLKILYTMRYLLEYSDPEHPVTMKEILTYLSGQDIEAERKSVYDDLEALRHFGLDVNTVGEGRSTAYYVATRQFELPELKLLVDSVQSSKFITRTKTSRLIKKIETLASRYEAQLLDRQVFVTNRIKNMNESIYYNVDEIHAGISQNRRIRFKYFEYTIAKERRFRKNGAAYEVSPYALTWDDENYYLVAFDHATREIRHYRVDKMSGITVTEEPREGQEAFARLDMGAYARKVFGMFSGQETTVTLRLENRLVGAVLDRLGQEVLIVPDGEEHFTVSASVVVSPQFFAWVTGFGSAARIIAPTAVAEAMRAHIDSIAALYHGGAV